MAQPDAEKPKIGRPSRYTQETADAICEWIAGGKSLVTFCAKDDSPGYTTVSRWLAANEAFRTSYAQAREAQADFLAEEIVQISDDGLNDTYQTENGPAVNHDAIARSRLRVDARKWYAGKLRPKKYGDKVEQVHTGADGGPVRYEKIERVVVDPRAPE